MFAKKICAGINCALSVLLIAITFVGCGVSKPVITLDKRNGEPLERVTAPHSGAQTYKAGTMLFPNPTRDGWFFNGWFLDEQCTSSAYGVPIKKDTTFYADWVDSITVPPDAMPWPIEDYSELFTVSSTVEPYGTANGLPQLKLTLSVTPTGDFTGENSTDRFELQVTHYWLSDEKFLDEYVSDEIVALFGVRDVWLEKDKGYSLHDEVFIMDYNNNYLEYPIYSDTFSNPHTKTVINYIFGNPTLQYKH